MRYLCLLLLPVVLLGEPEVYEAEVMDAAYGDCETVADPSASGGLATVCREGEHTANYAFATRYYPTPPGRYRMTWRLRVPDNTGDRVILTIDATQPGTRKPRTHRDLRPRDFQAAGEWQDIVLEFDRIELGRVQYRGRYQGVGEIAIDRLTVERVRPFTEAELLELTREYYPFDPPADPAALWQKQRNGRLDILDLHGAPHDDLWRTAEALAGIEDAHVDRRQWTKIWHRDQADGAWLPATYTDLFGYDIVLLTAGNVTWLQATGRRMLADFVTAGGTLIVCGGYHGYGKGGMGGTGIEALLDIETAGPWDLQPVADIPGVRWAHRLRRPAERTRIVRDVGKGRVLALLATPLGDGPTFAGTPDWPAELASSIRELAPEHP